MLSWQQQFIWTAHFLLKQGTSFQMLLQTTDVYTWAIYAVYAIAYTSNNCDAP